MQTYNTLSLTATCWCRVVGGADAIHTVPPLLRVRAPGRLAARVVILIKLVVPVLVALVTRVRHGRAENALLSVLVGVVAVGWRGGAVLH